MDDPKTQTTDGLNKQKHNDVVWLDVQSPGREVFETLEHDYHLHPVHLNESTQKVQQMRVEREEEYLFLVLHFPVYDARVDKILVGQVGVFLGKDYLITIRTTTSPTIQDLFMQADNEPERYFSQGSAGLLHGLISKIIDDISAMTENVELELDEIEDLVFDNNVSDAQRIGKVRQKIVKLRRVIGPKRMVLQDLAEQIDSFAGQGMAKYYSNNTKTVNKLWEVIEEAKETVEIYKDADFTTSTEQTNQILAVLTILFTCTIPITVAGTIYGMNVPIPGGIEAGAWTFFGPYTTFLILVIGSLVLALGMYLYFRKKKWF
jgi:magnesium transporter